MLLTCHVCGEEKDVSLFCKDKSKESGYRKRCKECHRKAEAERMGKREKETGARYPCTYYRRTYGVTVEQYTAAMATSPHCEVCGSTEQLCYDHCHDSMDFRGVLCRKCNASIGGLGDTIEGLQRAMDYLKRKGYEKQSN